MQTIYKVGETKVYAEDGGVWLEQDSSNDIDPPWQMVFDPSEAEEICKVIMKAKADAEAQ